MQRLPYDATTAEEAIQYYRTRALQLASQDFTWNSLLVETEYGYTTQFIHKPSREIYNSAYILNQHRNKGHFKSLVQAIKPIVTVKDCHIELHLERAGLKPEVDFKVIEGIYDSPEYKLIESVYGDNRANRSKVLLMNHIDEGIIIMSAIHASEDAMKAYCLHPLLQGDAEYALYHEQVAAITTPHIHTLTMEYRETANGYLSKRTIQSLEDIQMSVYPEVKDMLIADKIQNYKDFLLYHKGTHPNSDRLIQYFNDWLNKLECQQQFQQYMDYAKHLEGSVKIQNLTGDSILYNKSIPNPPA